MSRKRERSARELVSDCREGREALKKRGVAGSCSEMSHPSSFFLSRRIWCILHSGLQQITFKARAKNGEGRKTARGHPAGDTLGHNGDFIMLKVLPLRPPACDASFLACSSSLLLLLLLLSHLLRLTLLHCQRPCVLFRRTLKSLNALHSNTRLGDKPGGLFRLARRQDWRRKRRKEK